MLMIDTLYSLPSTTVGWMKNNPIKSVALATLAGGGTAYGYHRYKQTLAAAEKNDCLSAVRDRFVDITGRKSVKSALTGAAMAAIILKLEEPLNIKSDSLLRKYRGRWVQGKVTLHERGEDFYSNMLVAEWGVRQIPGGGVLSEAARVTITPIMAAARFLLFTRSVDELIQELNLPKEKRDHSLHVTKNMRRALPFSIWSGYGRAKKEALTKADKWELGKKTTALIGLNALRQIAAGEKDDLAAQILGLNAVWAATEGLQRLKACLAGLRERLQPDDGMAGRRLAMEWDQTSDLVSENSVAVVSERFIQWKQEQRAL